MSKKKQPFKQAVTNTEDIRNCYQKGLKALGNNCSAIKPSNTSLCNGSVDIDTCTKTIYPNAPRWDYAFSYKNEVYFVEVHSAQTGEVRAVLNKLKWLKDWLNSQAPEINKLKAKEKAFTWVSSGRFSILKTSPQYKQCAQKGLIPVSSLSIT